MNINEDQGQLCPYFIGKSKIVTDNKDEIIDHITTCHSEHQKLGIGDSTWSYTKYNFFGLSSPNVLMHQLYDELRNVVSKYVPHERIWMECWLNYHRYNEVLDWHDHGWDYHGYLSIDPKNTTTIFENWKVKNEVGKIYIGRGDNKHKVVVNEPYEGYRITIGFDIAVTPKSKGIVGNLGLMPL